MKITNMLAGAARRYYDAANQLTVGAVAVGVATGRIYCRAYPEGLAAGIDLSGVGWLPGLVLMTLGACHVWQHRAALGAAAVAVSVTLICVALMLVARMLCSDYAIVFRPTL